MDQQIITTIAVAVGVGLAAFVVKLVMKLAPYVKRKTEAPPPRKDAPLASEDTGRFQLHQALVPMDLGTRLDSLDRLIALQMRYFAKQSHHDASIAVLSENIDLICQIETHRDIERAHAAKEKQREISSLLEEIAAVREKNAQLQKLIQKLPESLEERFLIHPKRR